MNPEEREGEGDEGFGFGAGDEDTRRDFEEARIKFLVPDDVGDRRPIEAQLEARTGNIELARAEFFLTMCMEPRATFAKCMREDDFGIEQRARDADVGDHLGAITQPGINFQCFGL